MICSAIVAAAILLAQPADDPPGRWMLEMLTLADGKQYRGVVQGETAEVIEFAEVPRQELCGNCADVSYPERCEQAGKWLTLRRFDRGQQACVSARSGSVDAGDTLRCEPRHIVRAASLGAGA